ncbi:hypothetical protein B0H63DRAFT_230259 [Podospora didyma]|uniref:MYND-type domain-containing protein n=1 Tax=Podospora didyma TaxID=330526 RepID=A0AAE0NBT1_9PEZI|nr:hypothetical protein B0H63DRAFT_230259 [Podospora didyma]
MPLPDFTNTATFPSFISIPELIASPPLVEDGKDAAAEEDDWFLLGQVRDFMTITMPTIILLDRDNSPFALIFEGYGAEGLPFSKFGLKKGTTAVIPRARRTPQQGKRGFVSVEKGKLADIKVIPGELKRVLGVTEVLKLRKSGEGGSWEMGCETCGEKKGGMKKCTGCEEVKYCSKECQAKGWNDAGHKVDCKIIKAIREIWGK